MNCHAIPKAITMTDMSLLREIVPWRAPLTMTLNHKSESFELLHSQRSLRNTEGQNS